MPVLTVTKGLPGSGKTTWATEDLTRDGNSVRVNRDDLRAMLHRGMKWSYGREKFTKRVQTVAVRAMLESGVNVIVDDTNLLGSGTDRWKTFIDELNRERLAKDQGSKPHSFEVKDFTDMPLSECVKRDMLRKPPAQVGRGVIERMALESGLIDLSVHSRVAVFDIDGTLSNLDHRLEFVQKEPKDWNTFFDRVGSDDLFQTVAVFLRILRLTHTIILLSGRTSDTGGATNEWMHRNNIKSNYLFMRRSNDRRPDVEVKQELLDRMFAAGLQKSSIKIMFDDRPAVCDMWRSHSLPLVQVDHGAVIAVEPSAAELFGVCEPLALEAQRCTAKP